MKLGITTRLFAAVLATAVLVVGMVGGATHWNFTRGFLGHLNDLAVERMDFVVPRLARAYAEHRNWDFLRDQPRSWFGLLRPAPGQELPADAPALEPNGPPMLMAPDLTGATLRLGLLDAQGQWVAGYRQMAPDLQRRVIEVEGQVVGWLVLAPFQSAADGGDQRFQQSQLTAVVAIAALALALAVLIAWWVSRFLLAPVRQVAAATHRLAAGHYQTRVEVDSPDEIGQLARDFNHLARTLERNEALRRDFVADVSHELRTPLAVLRGELEALDDGIRAFNRQSLASLQSEVGHLSDLVNDLYELALSDAGALSYRMEVLDVSSLLQRVLDTHRHRIEQAGLRLQLSLPDAPVLLRGDEQRLQQLLDNLLENSRRYTDAPGDIHLRLFAVDDHGACHLELHDSAPGLPEDALAQVFERFYRVDASRARASGGAGLGLAICRNIVDAHDGEMVARASPLGGVCMAIRLPAQRAGGPSQA